MNLRKLILGILFWGFFITLFVMGTHKVKVSKYPVYSGTDLGVTYTPSKSVFKVWAPTASSVTLRLYSEGFGGTALQTIPMQLEDDGVWLASLKGDYKNQYYTYQATIDGKKLNEVTDPYARTTGANGLRGMVIDLPSTNPMGWENDVRPPLKSSKDIIIWEIHMRDLSIHSSSGIVNKGKFLGLTETGTKSPSGEKTGLDHIVDLGVTHVHLLPVFDYSSVDETKLDTPQFNWGYDPQNFNVPEGSYSTNPFDGNVRVKEFKAMVKALHDNGIRVVMDVVYNHTSTSNQVPFNQLVPNYYYRQDSLGRFTNASGCGNETASERPMVRKYMLESILYWANEYHIDGFRFDLMAIHDIETMNLIRSELNKIDPTIYMYGEGWMASKSPLPFAEQANKENAYKLNKIGVFSDELRDGLRGRWMEEGDKGYLFGNVKLAESVKYGIAGGVKHPQIDYTKVCYGGKSYLTDPSQFISYVSCHDNPCLWDKIVEKGEGLTDLEKIKIQKLANGIILTSQGVAFLHAGEEVVRTKKLVENSYNSPDSINNIDWTRKTTYNDVYQYYKKMIALRKNHPAFRMESKADIIENLKFQEVSDPSLIVYTLENSANGDNWKSILVSTNTSAKDLEISLPAGKWQMVANGEAISEDGVDSKIYSNKVVVPSRTMVILRILD